MITIVDYQMGNLRSVSKAIEKVGGTCNITGQAEQVAQADKLILPGVGAFGDAMTHLREGQLIEPIKDFVASGKPFLGICLGLQLLFETSDEGGEHEGLGIFPGKVVRFESKPGLKIPHMGWNQAQVVRRPPIWDNMPDDPSVYFVHSHYVQPADRNLWATQTEYDGLFCSMIWHENVVASQFHPEKSQKLGLRLLENFVRW